MAAQLTNAAAFPVEQFDLTSADGSRQYRVEIELPNRYHRGDARYPMVVVLDAQWVHGVVRDAFRILPFDRELPEAVIVGISHNTSDVRQLLQDRAVDYTPTPATAPPETGVRIPAEETGRAETFRRLLLDEILPRVEADYRINDDRTLVGHSFSALFGVDTLLEQPDAFARWVLASPSVWWDDQVMFAREAAHASGADDLPGRVFLSSGEHEGDGLGGHHAFYRQLAGRNYPSLNLTWARFPGETHGSVISVAVSRGLRAVFAP